MNNKDESASKSAEQTAEEIAEEIVNTFNVRIARAIGKRVSVSCGQSALKNLIVTQIKLAEKRGEDRVLKRLDKEEFYNVVNNGVVMLSADEIFNWLTARLKGE